MLSSDEHSAGLVLNLGRVYFRGRIVIEMYWATTSSTHLASECNNMNKLLDIAWSAHLPSVRTTNTSRNAIPSTNLLIPRNKFRKRFSAIKAARRGEMEQDAARQRLVQENVKEGSGKTLLIDIHIQTIPTMLSFNESELEAYEGGPDWRSQLDGSDGTVYTAVISRACRRRRSTKFE